MIPEMVDPPNQPWFLNFSITKPSSYWEKTPRTSEANFHGLSHGAFGVAFSGIGNNISVVKPDHDNTW